MKSRIANTAAGMRESLPVRGAWIEIVVNVERSPSDGTSLPVRGAWIEIIASYTSRRKSSVAPRKGSVD